MGIVGGGAYAEFCRMDYRLAMPIPASLTYIQAAAIPEVFITAHEALIHLGRLQKNETVLIHAAAGGVGSAAVQLAYILGATIFATADAKNREHVIGLGAKNVIDYQTTDFATIIANESNHRGVDVIIDFIGAPYFERNINSLAEGGRLIQVGLMAGTKATIALDHLLYKHLQIIGTVMKSRSIEQKQEMVNRFQRKWLNHFQNGILKPIIDSTFSLADASKAHMHMESGANIGKIILIINDHY
jgi:NADPH:quinone reductase